MTGKQSKTTDSRAAWEKVQDPELIKWLSSESVDVRELIVEANLPERKVTLRRGADGRLIPEGIRSPATPKRADVLAELGLFLGELLDDTPSLLKSAGAIAVKATGRQVRQFVDHPLVKGIRANRKLR